MHPQLFHLRAYHSSHVHLLHGNPYSSHHIYHLAFSRLCLSSFMWAFHTFLSSSSTFFLFRSLGVNFLAHSHPLHECSKCRKGVDQFDLYLASGLGTSPDKNPKDTKCETLVDSCSQQPFFLFPPSPLLHANTIWRHSSHGQRELLYPLFFIWLCGMSPQKLCMLSFTYSRTSRN